MFYSQAYAQPALESAIFWDRIISIESLGLAQVYDVEVQGTHNFIGNGIFAHNTYMRGAASPVAKPGAASPAEEKDGLCVTADTLLPILPSTINHQPLARDYILKPIIEVKPGDYVLSLNEETQAIEPHRINGLLDMGVKPVFKLTTAQGRSIKTTANHPYLTQMGWQKIGKLKIGEQIAVAADQKGMHSARNGNSSSWSGKTTKSLLVKSSGDVLLARSRWKASFIWLMSLGSILRRIILGWSTSGEWTAKSLSCVTSTAFSEMAKLKTSPLDRPFGERTTSCLRLVRNDKSPRCTFSSSKKRISLLQESRVKFADLQDSSGVMQGCLHMLRCQFRVGVLDFLQRGASLKHLENQIYHDARPFKTGLPVADIGISSNIIFNTHINFPPFRLFYHALTRLSSQFCPEAQAAQITQRPVASDVLWDKIISIEPLGAQHVYDIEVEGTHNFIGNGIFAHNTYMRGAASPVAKPGAASPAEEKDGLCVTADTLLPILPSTINHQPLARDYILKPIIEVKPGDYVLSLNEETQAIEPHRINGLLDMGAKPVFKLTTAQGRSIKTTANHPYLTAKGWVKVSELKAGDEIGVPQEAALNTYRIKSRENERQ